MTNGKRKIIIRAMKLSARFFHGIYRLVIKLALKLNYDFSTWKEEELPAGPKLFVSNHFSSSDVHFVTTLMKDRLHMVIGPGFNIPIVKTYLRLCEQIPANTKEARGKVVSLAVKYIKEGDSVYIFPEGKLNEVGKTDVFYSGAARIYLETGVPVIPTGLLAPKRRIRKKESQLAGREMTVVSRNYYANTGKAMTFPEELELAKTDRALAEALITEKMKKEVERLVDDIKYNKFWS